MTSSGLILYLILKVNLMTIYIAILNITVRVVKHEFMDLSRSQLSSPDSTDPNDKLLGQINFIDVCSNINVLGGLYYPRLNLS